MRTPRFVRQLLESRVVSVLARLLLTCAFWWGGLSKLLDFGAACAEAGHFFNDAVAVPVAVATIVTELAGSGMLIAGRFEWLGAGTLAVFTAAATFVAHDFWNVIEPQAHFREFNTFLEHLGLIGGLALAAVLAHMRTCDHVRGAT